MLGSARVVAGGEVYDRFPDVIDPAGRYVIYSHGLIVEGDDPRPVSPEFGVYDFPAVVRALAAGGGFYLIARTTGRRTRSPRPTRRCWTGGSAVCWRRKSRRAASRWSGSRGAARSPPWRRAASPPPASTPRSWRRARRATSSRCHRSSWAAICCPCTRPPTSWGRARRWPGGAASPRSRKSPSRRARSTARSTSRCRDGWGRCGPGSKKTNR